MSKIDRLYELREHIVNAFGKNEYNVGILINTEENYLSAIYRGHRVCRIKDQYNYDRTYRVVFEGDFSEFYHQRLPRLARCSNIESIVHNIEHRITQYNKKKGQNTMVTLSKLRDYILQEIGDLVSAVYEVPTNGISQDRIKINHDGCWACSIYRGKSDGYFNIIFYDPFTCRSAGYSPTVNLTVSEIPRAIKNRIDICEGANDNRININVDCSSLGDTVAKEIYMMSAKGSGKTRWVSDLIKSGTIIYNIGVKDVIFNDPATIVFWADGSKTVVKCQKGETFDPEKGLAMAISKKVLGNDYRYYETFAKYVGRYNKNRFNKALEEAKKIQPDEITYNGGTYVLKNKED